MNFDNIENLNEQQILELYNDILEAHQLLSTEYCPIGLGTGTYEYYCRPSGTCAVREICK